MRATFSYTALRVLLFLAVALVLALLGLHGITLLAVALIISAILSLLLLSKLRDRMSASVANRIDRFRTRLDAGTRAEDTDSADAEPLSGR
jgi:membrane protein implicated in regulation of membrane protease activity